MVTSGNDTGQQLDVQPGKTFTIGRGLDNDFVLTDIAVSRKHFDLRPAAIIRDLGLRKPIFQQVAKYGHFGRDDLNVRWESTDKAAALRSDVGL